MNCQIFFKTFTRRPTRSSPNPIYHPHHQTQSRPLRGVWHSVMKPEEGNGLRKSGLTRTHSASLGLYCAPLPPFCVKNHPTPFHYGLPPHFTHLPSLSFKRRTKCLTLRLNSLRPWSFIGQRLNARILVHEISFKANEDSSELQVFGRQSELRIAGFWASQ